MARVKPLPATIDEAGALEFFADNDAAGKAVWSSDFAKIKPVFAWNNHCGRVTMIYNAPLKKSFMLERLPALPPRDPFPGRGPGGDHFLWAKGSRIFAHALSRRPTSRRFAPESAASSRTRIDGGSLMGTISPASI